MPEIKRIALRQPYLILVGEEGDPTYAKTGLGIVQWRREAVAGQLRFAGAAVDLGVPDMDIGRACAAKRRSRLRVPLRAASETDCFA